MSCCFGCLKRHCSPTLLLDTPKQKFVINLPMDSAKKRSEALVVVSAFPGVQSIGLEGAENDKIAVVGKGVDPVQLTICLRKKVDCCARIDTVAAVEEKKKEEKKEDKNPTVLPGQCCSEMYVVTPVPEQACCTMM